MRNSIYVIVNNGPRKVVNSAMGVLDLLRDAEREGKELLIHAEVRGQDDYLIVTSRDIPPRYLRDTSGVLIEI